MTPSGLAGALADPTFELIPLKNVHEQAAALSRGATVSVTASPAKGIEATVELAIELEATGLRAIPHLSARMIRNRAHLAELYANPLVNSALTFLEVFPVGLVVTLASAAILRRRRPAAS